MFLPCPFLQLSWAPPDVNLHTSDARLGLGGHLGPGFKSEIIGEMEGGLPCKLRVFSRRLGLDN